MQYRPHFTAGSYLADMTVLALFTLNPAGKSEHAEGIHPGAYLIRVTGFKPLSECGMLAPQAGLIDMLLT